MQALPRVLSLLCIVVFVVGVSASDDSVSRVRECLSSQMKGRKLSSKTSQLFSMFLSPRVVEIPRALSLRQIKEIEVAANCVQTVFPTMFRESSHNQQMYNEFGGSNVTFVTELLPQLLPDLFTAFRKILYKGIVERDQRHRGADKLQHRQTFGIRSIYYVAGYRPGEDVFFRLQMLRSPDHPDADLLAVRNTPLGKEYNKYLSMTHHQRDAIHKNFVSSHDGTSYTLAIALTDVAESCDCPYLVEKGSGPMHVGEANGTGDDETDDYEELDTGVTISHVQKQHKEEQAKKSAQGSVRGKTPSEEEPSQKKNLPTEIEDLQAELGSAYIINAQRHGLSELRCGNRKYLIVEFWPYKDAPLQNSIPSLEQGKALGPITPEYLTVEELADLIETRRPRRSSEL